jgi:K(+)-stimulated pyrophosphate-energized sodium pump
VIISIALVLSILFFVAMIIYFSKLNSGNKKMQYVHNLIRKGSNTFLWAEYKVLAIFVILISLLIGYFHLYFGVSFFLGSLFSLVVGRIGMNRATKANVLVAESARKDVFSALKIAYYSGLFASIGAMFLGLVAILILYAAFGDVNVLYGFAFGASLVALFMRVGGGIFTKSADISADLTGKIEKNMPEDDPRNPAVVADLVGDNVGDVAGMSSDLFESFIASIIACMVILSVLGYDVLVPLKLVSIGIISCLASLLFVQWKNINKSILGSLLFSGVLIAALSYFLLNFYFIPILYGLIGGILVGYSVFYFTSGKFRPTRKIAESAKSGAALNVLSGLSNGLLSTIVPVLVIALVMILSYNYMNMMPFDVGGLIIAGVNSSFVGLLGIAISAVAMLSILGVVLASTIFGSITDNASGIAEFSKSKKSKENCSKLDSLGNSTAAIGKGFTISSAALTVLSLLASFVLLAGIDVIDIFKVTNMIALIIGGFIPFLFSSFLINAVQKISSKIVFEVRKQFRSKRKPDYDKIILLATSGSIKEMLISVLVVIVLILLIGFSLGVEALGAMIAGALVSSFLLSIFMTNAGGSLDNAKKLIEEKKYGSLEHKNSIVGDAVGDPLKDTAGPALNILIKLMAIISLLFVLLI